MIRLAAGDTAVDLAPEAGGSIAAFHWRGRPVLRDALPGAVAARDPLGMSAFPLVPYSNRIADGRFDWDGTRVQLPRNDPPSPHSIHGLGWRRPWAASGVTAAAARLTYVHVAGAWPWDFVATQDFVVQSDGLDWVIAVTNHGATDMPAGLGLHPYFPNPAGTALHAATSGWWRTDRWVMPTEFVADADADLTPRLHPADAATDNVFAGFGGDATVAWPDGTRCDIVAGRRAGWLVVWAPAGDTVTAIEAVSHPTDALNTPGTPGIVRLAPGQTVALGTSFRLRR
jgi:aldose 1-epimerase